MTRTLRIGIDTGGTFTDVVAFDEATGRVVTTKTPSFDPQMDVRLGYGTFNTYTGAVFVSDKVTDNIAMSLSFGASHSDGWVTNLVTGKSASGDPEGVSPSMARAVADKLGVPVKYVPFPKPGELADQAGKNVWDIGLIGAEPERAKTITFTAAYCEIEATYLVPAGSPIRSVGEVDQAGKRVAVTARSAYGLWLENNFKKGELLQFDNAETAIKAFVDQKMDAYAGLRPGLIDVAARLSAIHVPSVITLWDRLPLLESGKPDQVAIRTRKDSP